MNEDSLLARPKTGYDLRKKKRKTECEDPPPHSSVSMSPEESISAERQRHHFCACYGTSASRSRLLNLAGRAKKKKNLYRFLSLDINRFHLQCTGLSDSGVNLQKSRGGKIEEENALCFPHWWHLFSSTNKCGLNKCHRNKRSGFFIFFFFKSMYITTPSILAPAERSLPNRNASDDGSRAKL